VLGPAWRAGRTEVEVRVDLKTADAAFVAVTKNLSAGGVFVSTPTVRAVGDRISLTFPLPGVSQPISVTGEVRWTRESPSPEQGGHPTGMGLRFVDVPVGATIAIHDFLRARALALRSGAGLPKPE
jgi:uncharacterized protein (TIGR02266 family)